MLIETLSRHLLSASSRTSLIRKLATVTIVASTLFGTALYAQTPAVGEVAPDFTLSTPTGKSVQLSKGLKQASTVLIVLRGYPGYQCPFCQKQLHDFIEHATEFAAKKAMVLLVYPGPPAELDQRAKEALAKQADLPTNITLVIDPDYKVTNLYGLRWDAPHETAYPATFILDHNGKILFEKISHGHGDRASAKDVLDALL
ncbi:Peroxiredoxin [Terriglobus roseus DSM 18391]|uniref:thioredoxin-dependent peroxiredoxin n=1 Tax=Terriglobus roseus (strain DSM 18391 / NRRL B-41598 / KBS 63) TaxID=926566 RepID=I3ZBY5_TERRK|nr:Peroxiredoxin [Terriglobus roseus DSM 18391]